MDIIDKLVDPNKCNAQCGLLRLEAADEIARLRILIEALHTDRQIAANSSERV